MTRKWLIYTTVGMSATADPVALFVLERLTVLRLSLYPSDLCAHCQTSQAILEQLDSNRQAAGSRWPVASKKRDARCGWRAMEVVRVVVSAGPTHLECEWPYVGAGQAKQRHCYYDDHAV